MTQATGSSGLWMQQASPEACRERVRRTVAALVRARHLQLLVDHVSVGLLVGLCAATILVLAARLGALPVSPWWLTLDAILAGVAAGLARAWRRRPAPLAVAIHADVALRLKQRLSTAWELAAERGDDDPLAELIAAQAVKAGLPARAGQVFPVRLDRWGQLIPLAAMLLVLAAAVDVDAMRDVVPRQVDEQVVHEGERLAQFARAMQARSQRSALPRSGAQAAELERLGTRMESGELGRAQALAELRQMAESIDRERSHVQAEASRARGGERLRGSGRTSSLLAELDPKAMLEEMKRGPLSGRDTARLGKRLDDLERAGVPRRLVEGALDSQREGVDHPLRELLERLAQLRQALEEDEELRSARRQVQRSQETLGEASGTGIAVRALTDDVDWDEEDDAQQGGPVGADDGGDHRMTSDLARHAPRTGSQGGAIPSKEEPVAPAQPQPPASGPVMAAPSQLNPGDTFAAEGRTMPRFNAPASEDASVDARFAAQLESVLAAEQYPEHYKAFVRRYFLSLSQGGRKAASQPAAGGEAR